MIQKLSIHQHSKEVEIRSNRTISVHQVRHPLFVIATRIKATNILNIRILKHVLWK